MTPKETLRERFDKRFGKNELLQKSGIGNLYIINEIVYNFLDSELKDLIKTVEGMKEDCYIDNEDGSLEGIEGQQYYNQAIDDIISKIKELL